MIPLYMRQTNSHRKLIVVVIICICFSITLSSTNASAKNTDTQDIQKCVDWYESVLSSTQNIKQFSVDDWNGDGCPTLIMKLGDSSIKITTIEKSHNWFTEFQSMEKATVYWNSKKKYFLVTDEFTGVSRWAAPPMQRWFKLNQYGVVQMELDDDSKSGGYLQNDKFISKSAFKKELKNWKKGSKAISISNANTSSNRDKSLDITRFAKNDKQRISLLVNNMTDFLGIEATQKSSGYKKSLDFSKKKDRKYVLNRTQEESKKISLRVFGKKEEYETPALGDWGDEYPVIEIKKIKKASTGYEVKANIIMKHYDVTNGTVTGQEKLGEATFEVKPMKSAYYKYVLTKLTYKKI